MGIEKSIWAENNPEIASQASGWDPNKFSPKNSEKLSWTCEEGHRWNATILNRIRGKSECPHCAGNFNLITNSKFWTKKVENVLQSLFWFIIWALISINLGKAIYVDGYKWNRDIFLFATFGFFLFFPIPFYLATFELRKKESIWAKTLNVLCWILISLCVILAFVFASQGNNCLQSEDPYACWG